MFILAIALTVWISALHIAFLPILAVPVLLTFLKAKNEYREWYYL
jgi:predicted histidine transporter YuiF (NhaC family)